MITDFKLFENQETILNNILDKIQEFGKDSLTSNELNFLEDYPNSKLENDDVLNQETIQSRLDNLSTDLSNELSKVDDEDDDYPEYDGSWIQNKGKSSYSSREHFWFELSDTENDELTNTFIISGEMLFMYQDKKNIAIKGYFIINQETQQIFPYFNGPDGETTYDYASGNEDELYDLLDKIYDANKK